jgi:asparagine synthase (glutamine-hydrolysing)
MCGIAGIFSGVPVDERRVRSMTDVQAHRGPDGNGHASDLEGRLWLGHRRLSIIDLESGAQPISDADNRAMITFNGEIYNYQDIRRELEEKGVRFQTHSDTEVLLNAYLVWGKECLQRLRGMFAFAIWDRSTRSLFLARDHVGIKPLHYALLGDAFLFSSELKGLLAVAPRRPQVDVHALGLYLQLGYIPAPSTIYTDYRKLPPGHWMEVRMVADSPVVRQGRYWDVEIEDSPVERSEGEWIEQVDDCLRESTRYHLVSDVPVGFFLSGGIDSSLVSYYGSAEAGRQISTFSMGFSEKKYDELPYAQEVANAINSDHHTEVLAPASVEDTVHQLISMFDEPFGDSSALPTYYVCKALGGNMKVALAGDGGDEVWGGYKRYLQALQYEADLDGGMPVMKQRVAQTLSRLNPFDYKRQALEYYSQSPIDRYIYSMHLYFKDDMLRRLLEPGVHDEAIEQNYLGNIVADGESGDLLDTIQRLDLLSYLPEDTLTKVDRTSMASALEVRVPMLDRSVMELAFSMNSRLRVKPQGENGSTTYSERSLKYPLRMLVNKYFGETIAFRNKKGFSVPLETWFREAPLVESLRRHMHATEGCRGLVNTSYVEGLIEEHRSGTKNHQSRLWLLYILFVWWGYHEGENHA